jgi:hypothetical protein
MQNGTGTTPPQRIEVVLQSPPPTGGGPNWIENTVALAWPLSALLIVFLLRHSIADALKGLSARAKSLSLGVVAFDFGEAVVKGLTPESLDDIRDTASHAAVGDSSAALSATLMDQTPAECTVVNLGDGTEWITSRLYGVATFVARARGLRLIVFTAVGPSGRRFVGSAEPEQVRWALASAYPWLEAANIRAWNQTVANLPPHTLESPSWSISRNGQIEPWRMIQAFDSYKRELQAPLPPAGASGWLQLSRGWERAEYVTPDLLKRLLGEALNERAIQQEFDLSADELARRVLRFPLDYVPTVDRTGNFLRVVARRAYVSRTLRQVADS